MNNLPSPQLVFNGALSSEAYTASQLLSEGLNSIISPRWNANEPAVAFTCLASGVERALKLTYGMDLHQRNVAFASQKELRSLGHDLLAVEAQVMAALKDAAAEVGATYAQQLLDAVAGDPYWPCVLAALNAWAGAAGRYRDLTLLSGEAVPGDSPASLWNEVELQCVQDLGLLSELSGPNSRLRLVQVRTRLAESILKWWVAIWRSWTHGLLGADARSAGTALDPTQSLQLAPELIRLARLL